MVSEAATKTSSLSALKWATWYVWADTPVASLWIAFGECWPWNGIEVSASALVVHEKDELDLDPDYLKKYEM